MGMSMKSRKELTASVARRYRRSNRKAKQLILDEFCKSTGYTRSYAATLLRGYGKRKVIYDRRSGEALRVSTTKRPRRAGGRPRVYDAGIRRVVAALWARYGHLCGKRLAPLIHNTLDSALDDPFLKIDAQMGEQLRTISAATIDRLLIRERAKLRLKGRSHTRARRGGLWEQIPIRTFGDWKNVAPGHAQIDTVGHDGGYGSSDCAFTLCLTDICLGWTERRALANRAARWVIAALSQIREVVPIKILHLHPDNGSEFINHNLKTYCDTEHLELSRSRPERKNDNCYVEQKNFDTIRKLVGYARYASEEALETLNALYRVHGLLQNYFLPSQRLIEKRRVGSKVHKRYDRPQTPADRLLAHPDIPESVKRRVSEQKAALNPLELSDEVNRLQQRLFELVDRDEISNRQEEVS